MRSWLGAVVGVVLLAEAEAGPLLDREALAQVPLRKAKVLDPLGHWEYSDEPRGPLVTRAAALDQTEGYARAAVVEPGKLAAWRRRLATTVDPAVYPILVVTYRATGIGPSDDPFLKLGYRYRKGLPGPYFFDLDLAPVADGKVHEVSMDLRQQQDATRAEVSRLTITLHCPGPEPAIFDLLGLRFEAPADSQPVVNTDQDELRIEVRDPIGKPVADATVTADGDWLNAARIATTDRRGRASVSVERRTDRMHSLRVTKPGMAVGTLATDRWGTSARLMCLDFGCRYGGVVRNEAGEPVQNAVLHIPLPRHLGQLAPAGWRLTWLLTDEKGGWVTPVLPVVKQFPPIEIYHRDYLHQTAKDVPSAALRERKAELLFRLGGNLSVRVLGADGKPAGGAQINLDDLLDPRKFRRQTMKTDAEGRAAFADRLFGKKVLGVKAPGCAPALVPVEVVPSLPEQVVRLQAGGVIQGRVVDSIGKPVPRAMVTVSYLHQRDELAPLALWWKGRTDIDGRFAWREAPLGEAVTFDVSARGYLSRTCVLQAGAEERDVLLSRSMAVRGMVCDAETGETLPRAEVLAGWVGTGAGAAKDMEPEWLSDSLVRVRAGAYRLVVGEQEGKAEFVVEARAENYEPTRSQVFRFEGRKTVAYNFKMKKKGDLEGTVLLPDGTPAAGARIFLLSEGQWIHVYNTTDPLYSLRRTLTDEVIAKRVFALGESQWLDVCHRSPVPDKVQLVRGRALPDPKMVLVEVTQFADYGKNPRDPCRTDVCRIDTKATGQFAFPPLAKAEQIVVFHPQGFAQAATPGFGRVPDVRLQPWGRIEGECWRGRVSVPDVGIAFKSFTGPFPRTGVRVVFRLRAITSGQGDFSFARVPPGRGRVETDKLPVGLRGTMFSASEVVNLSVGETGHVSFGGMGRLVLGRLALPVDDGEAISWENAKGRIELRLDTGVPLPKMPDVWKGLPPEEASTAAMKWHHSEEGKALSKAQARYREARQKALETASLRDWRFPIAHDGSFGVGSIPPGTYVLRINLTKTDAMSDRRPSERYLKTTLTIPPASDTGTDRLLDLATLPGAPPWLVEVSTAELASGSSRWAIVTASVLVAALLGTLLAMRMRRRRAR